MTIKNIHPAGPHVQGFIRFASSGIGDDLKQLGHFEVLSRRLVGPGDGEDRHTYVPHPIQKVLAKDAAEGIKVIPIKLVCDDPKNSLSARYEAYDSGINRVVCAGNGETAQRITQLNGAPKDEKCPGPDACAFANAGDVRCSLSVRLKAQIEGQKDEFSVFEFQSGSMNTFMVLQAKLTMMHALFGGRLRHVQLQLSVEERSSVESYYEPFYVANVELAEGVTAREAMRMIKEEEQNDAGLDPKKMESAVAEMADNARLAPSSMDTGILEFIPSPPRKPKEQAATVQSVARTVASLVARARGDQSAEPEEDADRQAVKPKTAANTEGSGEFEGIAPPKLATADVKMAAEESPDETPPVSF